MEHFLTREISLVACSGQCLKPTRILIARETLFRVLILSSKELRYGSSGSFLLLRCYEGAFLLPKCMIQLIEIATIGRNA